MIKCKLKETVTISAKIVDGGAEQKTQSKTVIPSAEEQTVYPDEGYLLSSVKVEPMPAPPTQSKTVTSAVNQQTVLPDDGYYLSSVTVDGMPTETADVTPTEQAQTVVPSEGKLLSEVAVGAIPSQYHDTSSADITAADVTAGKIAFGVGGEIVGTNPFVMPTKGFIPTFDQDGFLISCFIYGFGDALPRNYGSYLLYREGVARNGVDVIFDVSVTKLSERVLYFCSGVKSITVNGNISSIDNWFITNANLLKTVVFNGTLGEINGVPFYGCPNVELYDFSHCDTVPTIASNTGALTHKSGCVIRVPQALLSEWQNADVWRDLTNVVWEGV